jgi:hypothetical protein
MYLVGFPLLVIPFAVYNIIEFLMPGATPGAFWANVIANISLASGEKWALTVGDLFIAISILILFVELLKATRLSSRSIVDHVLSTILFIIMLVEFLLVKQAASGAFFLLLVICFVDVVGGFSVTIRSAQRDITVDNEALPRA